MLLIIIIANNWVKRVKLYSKMSIIVFVIIHQLSLAQRSHDKYKYKNHYKYEHNSL